MKIYAELSPLLISAAHLGSLVRLFLTPLPVLIH